MNKFTTTKEIANLFWKLEDKYKLVDFEIDGIQIWQVIRWELFSSISKQVLNLDEAHANSNKWHKLKQIPSMLYNTIFNTAMFENLHDIVIFPHDRVRCIEGEYVDIYTKDIVDCFLKENKDILVLEKPYIQKHYTKKEEYIKYLDDSILLASIFSKFIIIDLKNKQNIITRVNKDINKTFSINISLEELLMKSLKKFKIYYKYYYKLLKKLNPRKIYVVVSYAYPWLIKAAKDLNIKVIELQHGAYSKYHLGYCYKKNSSLKYFPDEFFVWNNYWKALVWLPIKKENIKIYPFKFQEKEIRKYKNIKKIANQVVVLSQGTISNQMAKIILDNFDFFKEKTIKYKLHPGEIYRYKEYNHLLELSKKENVDIIAEGNLYELLATSEYQVGVYSTALYEGLEFGLKTILCDLPNIEFMEKLIELGKIEMVLHENV